jgi:4-hydroxymandelate oxidase
MMGQSSREEGIRPVVAAQQEGHAPAVAQLLCVRDAEEAAGSALPPDVADYVAGGSGAELTLAANQAALDRVFVTPRVLTDVSACDASARLAGCDASMPVAVAPMAYQRLVHADGELGLARAARDAGIPFITAMLSSTPLEDVAALGGVPWLQLYWLYDRGQVLDLVRRAEQAGCRALVLTLDVPRLGRRLRDLRNGFAFPPHITAANLGTAGTSLGRASTPGTSALAAHAEVAFDPSLSWADVTWLQEQTTLPLILKGILDPDDARRAAGLGVAGIVVSNHGGRQLDGAVPSVTALPEVCEAVAGRCEVFLDSGIRGGGDVVKALALGASGVLLGRPALWGLAAAGERGASQVISLLRDELAAAMMLAGCPDIRAARSLRTLPPAGTAPPLTPAERPVDATEGSRA